MKWFGRGLPRNVVALSVVSLLADAGGDMIAPLLPMFVATLASGAPQALGWIEGIADALSSLLKLVAGAWSDRAQKRKPIVALGYGLAAFARPWMAIATATWHVGLVRALDRTGKGLRTSPRDALLASAVPEERRGEAFSFHRAMDHVGAVVGPLIAIGLLAGMKVELRTVFWVAAVPGVLSLVAVQLFVREDTSDLERAPPPGSILGTRPPRGSCAFLGALAVFTLGNASDLFLLLRVRDVLSLERSLVALPLLWVGLHAVKATSSIFASRITNRVGARKLILAGWLYSAAIYSALALVTAPVWITALCVAYGVYHGLTEGSEKSVMAEFAPENARGAAFGWYHLTVGVCALPASVGFGWLWSRWGSSSAFFTSAALALIASVWLATLRVPSETRGSELGRAA